MRTNGDYYVTVVEDTRNKKIIGAASLIIERKFIHGCGIVSCFFFSSFQFFFLQTFKI